MKKRLMLNMFCVFSVMFFSMYVVGSDGGEGSACVGDLVRGLEGGQADLHSDSDDSGGDVVDDQLQFPKVLTCCPFAGMLNRESIKQLFVTLVGEEQSAIDGAAYRFNLGSAARALREAQGRSNVGVRLVVDSSSTEDYSDAIALLYMLRHGVVVQRAATYNDVRDAKKDDDCNYAIMHNKFFIFNRNARAKRSLVWTGSFNFTGQADKASWENVVILDDDASIASFSQTFALLFSRSSEIRAVTLRALEANKRAQLTEFAKRKKWKNPDRYAGNVIAKTKRVNEAELLDD